MRRFLMLALVLAPATCVTAADAKPAPSRAFLVKQVAALKKQVAARNRTIADLRDTVANLTSDSAVTDSTIADLERTNTSLERANANLASQNAALTGTVTTGVQGIAAAGDLQQLVNLVLAPAQDAWACHGDRTITIGYYASFTFSERLSSGACF